MTQSTSFARQLPVLTEVTRPFWTGGANGQLLITECQACGHRVHPPQPICPSCCSWEVRPNAVSGQAQVLSYTINHQAWLPNLPVPYVIAIVELREQAGLRLTTNIVHCAPEAVHIGMPVQVCFMACEDIWLPLFEPTSLASEH